MRLGLSAQHVDRVRDALRWRMLIGVGHRFSSGFRALCGGEPLPRDLAEALLAQGVELWNLYGPTETTVWSSCERILDAARIRVGRPIQNTAFYVLDERGRRSPIGAPGELFIGGLGVALGYLGREDLTAERFLADPFGEAPGGRIYRTGDCVRMLPDGSYEHRGRLDDQVKLRGFRIELGEIESAIRELALADDAAVALRAFGGDDVRLIAYLARPKVSLDAGALRDALSARLPAYMLPQHVAEIAEIPRTANGKIDRARLRGEVAPPATRSLGDLRAFSATEAAIAEIFARALRREHVGLDDDFFALGGHSLLAVQVAGELQNLFGIDAPLGLVLELPSVRALARQVESQEALVTRPLLLAGAPDQPPLFLLMGVQLYRSLAERLADSFSVFGVYVRLESMLLRESGELPSLEELADAYVTAIRLQQPRGPYRVGGFSMGGLMAYEVAQRLLALGEDVENVLLLDTHLPERGIRRVRIHLQRASDWLSERAHCFVRRHFTRDASLAASAAELRMSRARGYRTAVLRYGSTMRRSRAPATLVVAVPVGATLEGTDLTRWRSLAPALRVEVIVGDHDTILTEPCVRSLAEICRGSLGCWQRAPVGQTT